MYEAHIKGQTVVKSCHKELAEVLRRAPARKGLTITIQPINRERQKVAAGD